MSLAIDFFIHPALPFSKNRKIYALAFRFKYKFCNKRYHFINSTQRLFASAYYTKLWFFLRYFFVSKKH